MAVDAELFSLKVFNKTHHTRPKFILKALKFAEKEEIRVLNLPFSLHAVHDPALVAQISRMAQKGFLLIVSAGNEGGRYGSLSHPGNLPWVFTVGSFDFSLNSVSRFSAKGPYVGELRDAAFFKPDLLVVGSNILGSDLAAQKCLAKSGTSLSSAIFAGAVALVAASGMASLNLGLANLIKLRATIFLENKSIFAQGAGHLDFPKLLSTNWTSEALAMPVFVWPNSIDLRQTGNRYFHPLNLQPLFPSAFPTRLNLTLNSALNATFRIVGISKEFLPGTGERYLDFQFVHADSFRFVGPLGVVCRVSQDPPIKSEVEVHVSVLVQKESDPEPLTIKFRLLLTLIPRPPKSQLILFDNFHNLVFPHDVAAVR